MPGIKITELDHIVLNVGDIERSLKFYIDILGLQGERVNEFREGKVGFPSVRINADTIIDLFPKKERTESAAQLERSHERLLDGDLLIQFEADEERQRIAGDERIGLSVTGVVEPGLGHLASLGWPSGAGRDPPRSDRARRPTDGTTSHGGMTRLTGCGVSPDSRKAS